MSVEEVFRTVVAALDAVDVPYMITGSFASSIHGEPRASKDIDIVIAPTREQLLALVGQFPSNRYYVDEEDALQAFSSHGMFNVIDFASGWKIDFIVLKARAFSQTEFSRRREEQLGGLRLTVAAAEDILLAKLEWAKMGESRRQLEDAASIIRIKGDLLDTAYLERWVTELGLEPQWSAARALAV